MFSHRLHFSMEGLCTNSDLFQTKIALKVSSEEELLTLEATADSLGIITNVVADAGRTQIAAGRYCSSSFCRMSHWCLEYLL